MSDRYKEIKRYCRQRRILFEDPDFQANDASLDRNKQMKIQVKWMRPTEIVENPKMFIGGADQLDICQGFLGDCWLLASLASLTLDKMHLKKVVPEDQDFDDRDYCGCFRFNFWQFGEWREIIIDDRLPCYYNGRNREWELIYVHSREKGEMWSALVEKAYAKIFGSYGALKGGLIGEALVDFTGGISEDIDLSKPPPKLFNIMYKSCKQNNLMGCSITAQQGKIEEALQNGLVRGHAYSITGVEVVNTKYRSEVQLVKIRNPWGNDKEWTGDWGDSSSTWETVSTSVRKSLLTDSDDGEFWMSFSDFCKEFSQVIICHKEGGEGCEHFNVNYYNGQWKKGTNAGGCRNFIKTFATNPQYRIKLEDADDDDDRATLIISLMQKNYRGLGPDNNKLTIGYMVYPVPEGTKEGTLPMDHFKYTKSASRSPSFVNSREVVHRVNLDPGEYVIIPSTFQPECEGNFFLRVLTEKDAPSQELNEDLSNACNLMRSFNIDSQNAEQNNSLKQVFHQIAGDDGLLEAKEVCAIMEKLFPDDGEKPTIDQCHSFLAVFDKDDSGKLDFEEFLNLCDFISRCLKCFSEHMSEDSSLIDGIKLKAALKDLEIRVTMKIILEAVKRYGDPDTRLISSSDFCVIAAKIQGTFTAISELRLPMKHLETILCTTMKL